MRTFLFSTVLNSAAYGLGVWVDLGMAEVVLLVCLVSAGYFVGLVDGFIQ